MRDGGGEAEEAEEVATAFDERDDGDFLDGRRRRGGASGGDKADVLVLGGENGVAEMGGGSGDRFGVAGFAKGVGAQRGDSDPAFLTKTRS